LYPEGLLHLQNVAPIKVTCSKLCGRDFLYVSPLGSMESESKNESHKLRKYIIKRWPCSGDGQYKGPTKGHASSATFVSRKETMDGWNLWGVCKSLSA